MGEFVRIPIFYFKIGHIPIGNGTFSRVLGRYPGTGFYYTCNGSSCCRRVCCSDMPLLVDRCVDMVSGDKVIIYEIAIIDYLVLYYYQH